MNELYTLKCQECKLTFKTDKKLQRLCPGCRKRLLREKRLLENINNKKPSKTKASPGIPRLSIKQVCKILRKYNKSHNTKYTYGQFVNLIYMGQIDLEW